MTTTIDSVDDLRRGRLGTITSFDPSVRAAHRADRSGAAGTGLPDAVVFAESTADVAALLAHATATGRTVVPRGAGTGLAGGATASAGEVVLSTERLNQILEVSGSDRTIRVQAGVITADVDAAAAAVGLRYAPDPGSVDISTIGGNIATNAGGLRCVKYGVTGDSVLGLEAVTGSGEVITTGTRTRKGVTGLDLTALLVGSEGVLGIVTEATLRLQPIPPRSMTVVATYRHVADAARAAHRVLSRGVVPAALELLDSTCLVAIDAYQGSSLSSAGGALLLARTDGWAADVEARICATALQSDAVTLTTIDDHSDVESSSGATDLITARRNALPALEQLGRVLIEDVAVPLSAMAAMVERIEAIAVRTGVRIATMAHAGDGNLHPIIISEAGDDEVGDASALDTRLQVVADEIFTTALELGGTLTGEHGVGILKRRWLASEVGRTELGLMASIKRAFDPAGILNPGRAI